MSFRQLINHWLHPRFRYKQLAIIHGLRLALAFLIGGLIGDLINEPHAVWLTVTITVVMASLPHTGSIVEKGKQRFIGTTLGAVAGLLVIYFAHQSEGLAALAIFLIIGYCGYWAVRGGGYIAQLTCVTIAIVSTNSTLEDGLWRIINVYVGVLLAIVFGMLFPERARDHWYFMLEESVEGVNWLYREWARDGRYDSTLADGLSRRQGKMRELMSAVARESGLSASDLKITLSLLHRAQISIEFLANEGNTLGRPDSESLTDEARIIIALRRLAGRFNLPIAEDIPPLSIPPSPQQAWLINMLAHHLEELAANLDKLLPKLRDARNKLPVDIV